MNYIDINESNQLQRYESSDQADSAGVAVLAATALEHDRLRKQNRLRAVFSRTGWTITVINGMPWPFPLDTVLNAGDLFEGGALIVQSPGVYQASGYCYFNAYQPIAPLEPLKIRDVVLHLFKNGSVYSNIGGIAAQHYLDSSTALHYFEQTRMRSGHMSGADWIECEAGDKITLGATFTLDTGFDIPYFDAIHARLSLERTGDIIKQSICC